MTDIAPAPSSSTSVSRSRIQESIPQVVAQESLRNERKVAYVRTVVLLISSVLDILIFLFPGLIGQRSVAPTIAMIALGGLLISIIILRVLLQPSAWRWLPQLHMAIPLFDTLLLALFITNIWHVLGSAKPGIITNIAALCCLVAVSGGIRIRRRASIVTTVMALANFAYATVLFQLDIAISLFVMFTIFGTGMMGMLTAGIVRRQGKNEAGRLLMQQFLPDNVVEAAFERPSHFLDPPKAYEVTIMVTDLRGFTHYSEKLDPWAVMNFLNQLQGFLARTVEGQGGWVDKFMGDGMLAVFGAPRPLDNSAEQAMQAAQSILKNIQDWSPLPIGIGIHSGRIVAGCLGDTGHLEFTVIGDTVNVAARLEALTKELDSPLLVSQSTQRQLQHRTWISLGKVPLRGRDEQIEVFTLPTA